MYPFVYPHPTPSLSVINYKDYVALQCAYNNRVATGLIGYISHEMSNFILGLG